MKVNPLGCSANRQTTVFQLQVQLKVPIEFNHTGQLWNLSCQSQVSTCTRLDDSLMQVPLSSWRTHDALSWSWFILYNAYTKQWVSMYTKSGDNFSRTSKVIMKEYEGVRRKIDRESWQVLYAPCCAVLRHVCTLQAFLLLVPVCMPRCLHCNVGQSDRKKQMDQAFYTPKLTSTQGHNNQHDMTTTVINNMTTTWQQQWWTWQPWKSQQQGFKMFQNVLLCSRRKNEVPRMMIQCKRSKSSVVESSMYERCHLCQLHLWECAEPVIAMQTFPPYSYIMLSSSQGKHLGDWRYAAIRGRLAIWSLKALHSGASCNRSHVDDKVAKPCYEIMSGHDWNDVPGWRLNSGVTWLRPSSNRRRTKVI